MRVWFDTGGAYTDERRLLALAGFDFWTQATGGVVGYRLVEERKEADVVVRFDAGEFIDEESGQVGRTWTASRGAWLAEAQIALATAGTRPEELTEVAAHEWGHALGIHGHSGDADDLMYATGVRMVTNDPRYTPAARRPSLRDVNTLKTLYAPLFPARVTDR